MRSRCDHGPSSKNGLRRVPSPRQHPRGIDLTNVIPPQLQAASAAQALSIRRFTTWQLRLTLAGGAAAGACGLWLAQPPPEHANARHTARVQIDASTALQPLVPGNAGRQWLGALGDAYDESLPEAFALWGPGDRGREEYPNGAELRTKFAPRWSAPRPRELAWAILARVDQAKAVNATGAREERLVGAVLAQQLGQAGEWQLAFFVRRGDEGQGHATKAGAGAAGRRVRGRQAGGGGAGRQGWEARGRQAHAVSPRHQIAAAPAPGYSRLCFHTRPFPILCSLLDTGFARARPMHTPRPPAPGSERRHLLAAAFRQSVHRAGRDRGQRGQQGCRAQAGRRAQRAEALGHD